MRPVPAVIELRAMRADDWPAVQAIYLEGIRTGQATFESEPPDWDRFNAAHLDQHRLVAVAGDRVVGWVAVSAVSARPVYAGVVEHSVYVAESARHQRIGHLLLSTLITSTEQAGIWTIQSSVFPENAASLALHAAHGFRQLGRRQRIALMTHGPHAGQWRDTITLERRSSVSGR